MESKTTHVSTERTRERSIDRSIGRSDEPDRTRRERTATTTMDANARAGRSGADADIAETLKREPTEEERRGWRRIHAREVERHRTLRDGWIVVRGRVYDISAFATTHPGFNNAGQVSTALAIARMLGKEASEEFEEIHSTRAWAQLGDFQIGVLAREEDGEEEVDGVVEESAPVPSWLSRDRDFWVKYAGGVSQSVLRYLEANGLPQDDEGEKRDDRPQVIAEVGYADDDDAGSSKGVGIESAGTPARGLATGVFALLGAVVAGIVASRERAKQRCKLI